jgi:hypothetical protein
MPRWEYKTLVYSAKRVGILRVAGGWRDTSGTWYGPISPYLALGMPDQLAQQLQAALTTLDGEGWELVSLGQLLPVRAPFSACAILRRPCGEIAADKPRSTSAQSVSIQAAPGQLGPPNP